MIPWKRFLLLVLVLGAASASLAVPVVAQGGRPPTTVVEIEVVDDQGRPMPAIEIELRPWDDAEAQREGAVIEAKTDARGIALMTEVPPGRRWFRVSVEGFLDYIGDVKVGEKRLTIPVRLSRGASLAGRVVDQHGVPMADLDVRASSRDANGASATTDASGEYRMSGLEPGTFEVKGSKGNGLATARLEIVAGISEYRLDLQMKDLLHDLAGQVVDPSGAPVLGAQVVVQRSPSHADYAQDPSQAILTNSDLYEGKFHLQLVAGPYRLSVFAPNVRRSEHPPLAEVELQLPLAEPLRLVVTP